MNAEAAETAGAAAPSHAGAVVARVVAGHREYLLVGPSSGEAEWLLPKGHIEAGETPEAAALREVGEEAGIRAGLVCSLGMGTVPMEKKPLHVAWFLATHLAPVTPKENRATCWLRYEEARTALSFDEAREILSRAEDAAARVWPDEDGPSPLYTQTLQSQLEFLNDRMKETSDTANRFLTRFVFGGMIAVVALLNVDLVLLKQKPNLDSASSIIVVFTAALLVLVLSYLYFSTVEKQYTEQRLSHRKLKYKFELTLHALLTSSSPARYVSMMEANVAAEQGTDPEFPRAFGFASVSSYLLDHHRFRFQLLKRKGSGYVGIAMLLVLITFVIRLAGVFVTAPEAPPATEASLESS
jgi:8-oxo-dGTP pyrophosphatase MutT (NUDIX family)